MSDTPGFFTSDEWDFITDIDRRFPHKNIAGNFLRYLALPEEERIPLALQERQQLLRTGWGLRHITSEDCETVGEHIADMTAIAKTELAYHENLQTIVAIIESHDTGEVIASDFTPYDAINKDEKRLIELLATCVIYAAQPEMIERWLDYEDQRTPEAKIVKDLDKAQMYLRADRYRQTHAHIDLTDFATDCQNYTWRTVEGKQIAAKYKLVP